MSIYKIIEKACTKETLTRNEIIELLSVKDASKEAFAMRAAAAGFLREQNGNAGYIFGQIGLECSPCPGNCTFCSCAEDYTMMGSFRMDKETLVQKVNEFTANGDLHTLYLMTMHEYNLDFFLDCVKTVKKALNGPTKIVSNVGDTSYEDFVKMKEAGIFGVYHCWRLGEGRDTKLNPEDRKQTMLNAKKAGLEVFDALEPIGPEHTAEEMADHIIFSRDIGTYQCGAMKRIAVPGTPFENLGEISNFTLSKILAALVLSLASMERMPVIGTHEPNLLGYTSGANMICAESGVNPRDIEADTKENRGWDVVKSRLLLKEAGFDRLILGDDTSIEI